MNNSFEKRLLIVKDKIFLDEIETAALVLTSSDTLGQTDIRTNTSFCLY